METAEVREFREQKVNAATREAIDFIIGDEKRADAFIAALAEQSTKSAKGGVDEKARVAFEASIGSTAEYGDEASWGDVGLYFLYAGDINGI